jgi:hypothetical protein
VFLLATLLLLLFLSCLLLWTDLLPVDYDYSQRSHWWDSFLLVPGSEEYPQDFCETTMASKQFVADDRGRICSRVLLDPLSGCCNASLPTTSSFSCNTCGRASRCCRLYEFCVTCCMRQEHLAELELALTPAPLQTQNFSGLSRRFGACSALCRTSSESVDHERSYRSTAVYCFSLHGRGAL